jgi:hypothetical protein
MPEQPPPVTTLPAGSVCIRDGWCYQHPLPHGLDLASVWASSPHDAWFVARGEPVLLHADGDRWVLADVPVAGFTPSFLRGGRPGEVWALSFDPDAGLTGVFRREDGRWVKRREVRFPIDFFVGTGGDAWVPSSVFADGWYDSTVDFFDASTETWTSWSFPRTLIGSVWASSPRDVWVGGSAQTGPNGSTAGQVFHFDGASWQRLEAPVPMPLVQRIRGSGPDNVWLAGIDPNDSRSALARWRAGTWEVAFSRQMPGFVHVDDLDVVGPDDVWVSMDGGLYHSTGTGGSLSFARVDIPATTFSRAADGSRFFAGDRGEIWFSDSRAGAPRRLTVGPRQSTVALWGTGPQSVWAAGVDDGGAAALLHVAAAGASQIVLPGAAVQPRAVWAASDDDVWVVGNQGFIAHGNGSTGEFTVVPAPSADDLTGLWGSAHDDVWIAGGDTLLRWNGTAFERPPYGEFKVFDVAGSGRDDVWVVGADKVAHLQGGTWTTEAAPGFEVGPQFPQGSAALAVWANSPDDVFVGVNQFHTQSVWQRDGSTTPATWTLIHDGTRGSIGDLFGARAGDLWSSGVFIGFHWNGYTVSFDDTLFNNWDARYWGPDPDDMHVATGGGILRRRK